MKNRKYIFGLLAVLLLSVVLYWLWHGERHTVAIGDPSLRTGQKSNVPPVFTAPTATNPPLAYPSKPAGITAAAWAGLKQYYEWTTARNSPIEFYARALDQDGNPVAGVTLSLEISRFDDRWLFRPDLKKVTDNDLLKNERIELISGADGRFNYSARKGTSVNVNDVKKTGYLWERPPTMGSFGYAENQHSVNTLDMTNAFNPKTGYLFHLWKKGETEKLVSISLGVTMPDEGHQAWFNIFNQEIKPPSSEWADFTIVETMLHPNDPDRQYDRSISIQGLNGAMLMETSNIYPYLASESGYLPEYKFDGLPSTGRGPGGTWDWSKNFYVVARGGRVHAGLSVSFVAGRLFFGFNGYLNPTGSRNIEPDPAKLITDPAEIRRLDEATRVK